MALNINWRFAGPQNINVPQSNFLQSLDKNIQNALGIKKEFDKKRADNEMSRLMTEDAENKLAALINEKDELTTQYNLLTADEQLAQKTYYENKLKELDIQIESARKEVADARMSANQFKTTGTTDFFRWKKDKEYAADVAAVNREMLNEQIKQERLSDISGQIKEKRVEFDNSNDKDEKIRIDNVLKLLNEEYNRLYDITTKKEGEGNGDAPPSGNATPKVIDIKSEDYIQKEIDKLIWDNNLAGSDAVAAIQGEIDKYTDSKARDKLNQALKNKIDSLEAEKAAEDAAAKKAEEDKDEAARKARKDAEDNLNELYSDVDAEGLRKFINKTHYTDLKNLATKYLIGILRQTKPGCSVLNNTRVKAAKRKFDDNDAMKRFIDDNAKAINAE